MPASLQFIDAVDFGLLAQPFRQESRLGVGRVFSVDKDGFFRRPCGEKLRELGFPFIGREGERPWNMARVVKRAWATVHPQKLIPGGFCPQTGRGRADFAGLQGRLAMPLEKVRCRSQCGDQGKEKQPDHLA